MVLRRLHHFRIVGELADELLAAEQFERLDAKLKAFVQIIHRLVQATPEVPAHRGAYDAVENGDDRGEPAKKGEPDGDFDDAAHALIL